VHTRTPVGRYLPVALIKLLVHPALIFAIGLAARAAGASLTPFTLMVLTLTAALPSASNVSLLAERFGADNGRIARIIMASTVIAFATFSATAWLFGVERAA
jgi:malonate transporter and related proteins